MTPIAIALVEYEGRFLVGQRDSDVPLAGMTEFPGGKIRHGETPAAAAERECLEETGLAVCAESEFDVILHEYEHGVVQLHFWVCSTNTGGAPRAPFRWVAHDELITLSFPAANTTIVERLGGRSSSGAEMSANESR